MADHQKELNQLIKQLQKEIADRHVAKEPFASLPPVEKLNKYSGKLSAFRNKKKSNFNENLSKYKDIESKSDLLNLLTNLQKKYDIGSRSYNIMNMGDILNRHGLKRSTISKRLEDRAAALDLPVHDLAKNFKKNDENVLKKFSESLNELEKSKEQRRQAKIESLFEKDKKRKEYIEHYKNMRDVSEKEKYVLDQAAEEWAKDLTDRLIKFDNYVLKNPNISDSDIETWETLKKETEEGLKTIRTEPAEYRKFLEGERVKKAKKEPKTLAEFNKRVVTDTFPGSRIQDQGGSPGLLVHINRSRNDPEKLKSYQDFINYLKKRRFNKNSDMGTVWMELFSNDQEHPGWKDTKSQFTEGLEALRNPKLRKTYLEEKKKKEELKAFKKDKNLKNKNNILELLSELSKSHQNSQDAVSDIENRMNKSKTLHEKEFNRQLGEDLHRLDMSFVGRGAGARGSRYKRAKEKIIEDAYGKFQNDMQNLFLKQSEIGLNDYTGKKELLLDKLNQKNKHYHDKKINNIQSDFRDFAIDYERKAENLQKKKEARKQGILKFEQSFPHLRSNVLKELTSVDPNFSGDSLHKISEMLNTARNEVKNNEPVQNVIAQNVKARVPFDDGTGQKRVPRKYL